MIKDCQNCKHADKKLSEYPCDTCQPVDYNDNTSPMTHWEHEGYGSKGVNPMAYREGEKC